MITNYWRTHYHRRTSSSFSFSLPNSIIFFCFMYWRLSTSSFILPTSNRGFFTTSTKTFTSSVTSSVSSCIVRYMTNPSSKDMSRMHRSPSLLNNDNNNNNKLESDTKPLVIVIAGPTGVGKSAVAARLCKSMNGGRIISADSVQAYRGVQIGANKPTAEELEQTVHYLVNVVEATGHYTAAEWMRDATALIQACTRSNSGGDDELVEREMVSQSVRSDLSRLLQEEKPIQPVVVGGTMMYVQWLVHGKPDAPRPSDEIVQRSLEDVSKFQVREEGWDECISYYSDMYGDTFRNRIAKLGKNDWYRLRRTLEVVYSATEVVEKSTDFASMDSTDDKKRKRLVDQAIESVYKGRRYNGIEDQGYDVRCFFLCPHDRMMHTQVVDERCEDMIIKGLITETAQLSFSGELPDEGQPARAIGYRQTLDYLRRQDPNPLDDKSFSEFLDKFRTATRQYAKKQMQWFRRDGKFMFIPVDLTQSSNNRITVAASSIENLCQLDRSSYEAELANPQSISAITIANNEGQAKKMKFYVGKRYKLIEGSDSYRKVIEEADSCTGKMQGKELRK